MTYTVPFCIDLGLSWSGLTLTATVKTIAGVSVASDLGTITEDPAASGVYWWEYGSFADGMSYRVLFYNGSDLMAAVPVSPADAAIAPPLGSDWTAVRAAQLDRLTSGRILAMGPVASRGNVGIVQGDDYLTVDGRQLEWTDTANAWPVLSGATVTFALGQPTPVFSKAVEIITATGSNKKVRIQLTTANTTAIPVGTYEFTIRAVLANFSIVTLVRALLINEDA